MKSEVALLPCQSYDTRMHFSVGMVIKQMLNERQGEKFLSSFFSSFFLAKGGETLRQANLERICMVMLGQSRCSWEKDEVGNKIGLMSTGPILGRGRQGWAINSRGAEMKKA